MQILTQRLQALAQKRLNVSNYNITSQWLIGFIEAEGSFIGKKGQQPYLHISQHTADWFLMEAIAKFIGYGNVKVQTRKDGRSEAILIINDKDVLRNKIIPMCQSNLKSIKKFNQFNEWVKNHFSDLAEPLRVSAPINSKIDNQWIVGFTDGDGSFYPMFHKAKDYKYGYQIQATFDLAQLDIEQELLNSIGNQLSNGAHKWAKSGNTQHMRIVRLETCLSYIEPFFIENPLQSRKQYDFIIWQEILNLMKSKKHLTEDGITIIRELQALQNQYRLSVPESVINPISKLIDNSLFINLG